MSRHHKTGQPSARDVKAHLERQIAQQMYEQIEEAEYRYMSQRATIMTFFCQYASVQLEDFIEHFEGNNCTFTNNMRNKARKAMIACDEFMKYFEPLIRHESSEEWSNGYSRLQYALDNWFGYDTDTYVAYDKDSDAERAKEICHAAALRYHDPYEKDPQRIFEAGFREGAAYADIHPLDSITIIDNGVKKRVTLKELARAYTGKNDIIVELNAKKTEP